MHYTQYRIYSIVCRMLLGCVCLCHDASWASFFLTGQGFNRRPLGCSIRAGAARSFEKQDLQYGSRWYNNRNYPEIPGWLSKTCKCHASEIQFISLFGSLEQISIGIHGGALGVWIPHSYCNASILGTRHSWAQMLFFSFPLELLNANALAHEGSFPSGLKAERLQKDIQDYSAVRIAVGLQAEDVTTNQVAR